MQQASPSHPIGRSSVVTLYPNNYNSIKTNPRSIIKLLPVSSLSKPSFTRIFQSRSLHSSPSCLLKLTSQLPPRDFTCVSTSRFISGSRKETTLSLSPLHSSNSTAAVVDGDAGGNRSFRGWIELVGEVLSTAFPVWVALGCLLGLLKPSSFNWVRPKWTILGITITMLGMGMTLTFDDLRGALSMPKELLAGFVLQYSIMPLSGYFVSKLLGLPSYYAAGLILVGCCPGGTASNIVTYIGRGNVALSVLMTAASTLSAVVMTPFLTAKLAGQFVAVDAAGLVASTMQVVLLPVLVGALLNQYCKSVVEVVSPLMPPLAVLTVAVLCGNAIAQSASSILMSGKQVVLATCLLHASGFFFGYALSRVLGLDISSSRTISIEVGMQNSVLGVVLAGQHFGNPLTAVPCAVSSVCHSIFGSVLAGIWRYTTPTKKQN
ncbi:probable sodium/metabolite cotransporter BASS1, chloroplastic [Telopea speciosissima]|uniref:probable sodium/metabolite cotransporter BASS1, chloroplastic n=1 Tax=Telopea speciosissima TaxID=54955 RepID=UPI001CC55019|nr:probable sodium/metabolite cotransporter BASS1, chloroplastic [Telopea speciosissima]